MARITATLPPPFFVRYLVAVLLIPLLSLNRTHIASACFALYITSSILLRSFASPWLGVGWTALAIGFWLAPKSAKPRPLFWGLIALLGFHAVAIPGSLIWGSGNWESTTGVLLWMAPSIALYLAGTRQTLTWLTPVVLVHAGLVLYQSLTAWRWVPERVWIQTHPTDSWIGYAKTLETGQYVATGFPVGLTNNVNLAAGVLVLGLVMFMATRRWQAQILVIPLALAVLATGSRWGLLVAAVVLVLMTVSGHGSVKTIGALILGLCAAFVVMALVSPNGYQIAGYNSFAAVVQVIREDVHARLAIPHLPSFLPHGVAAHPGLHNVPLRIAVESGIQAAVLWVGISAWALWCKPSRVEWWLLFALVLLSLLDYYTWMGHMGGFWWLLIGLLTKSRPSPARANRPTDTIIA